MDISSLTDAPRLTVETIRSAALSTLRSGQQVEARVLSPVRDNQLKLSIRGNEVRAHSAIKAVVGDKLLLAVVSTGTPLQMKVLRGVSEAPVQARAFRAALPRHMPLQRLFGQLTAIASSGPHAGATRQESKPSPSSGGTATGTPGAASGLPAALILARGMAPAPLPPETAGTIRPDSSLLQTVQRILDQTLQLDEALTPTRLRAAFEASGLTLEARLAAGLKPQSDLKASLLQLLSQLRTRLIPQGQTEPSETLRQEPAAAAAPGTRLLLDLLTQTEGSLARLLLNQLTSLPAEEGNRQVWQFELPIRLAQQVDNFRLQVSRDRQQRTEAVENGWTVRLDFELAALGPVSSRLVLRGNRISSHFVAQQEGTRRLIAQALPVLEQAFDRAGLEVDLLTARQDQQLSQAATARPPFPLLDLQV